MKHQRPEWILNLNVLFLTLVRFLKDWLGILPYNEHLWVAFPSFCGNILWKEFFPKDAWIVDSSGTNALNPPLPVCIVTTDAHLRHMTDNIIENRLFINRHYLFLPNQARWQWIKNYLIVFLRIRNFVFVIHFHCPTFKLHWSFCLCVLCVES